MKSQVFDFKRIYIFVAKTTKSENEDSPQQATGYQKEMHSDEKPRFLKLFPLSGNPIASYGESVRFTKNQQVVKPPPLWTLTAFRRKSRL